MQFTVLLRKNMSVKNMATASNMRISNLPKIQGNRNIIATRENGGSIIITTEDSEINSGSPYYVSLDENHAIFELLTNHSALTVTKAELLDRYGINFLDFKTIPKVNA